MARGRKKDGFKASGLDEGTYEEGRKSSPSQKQKDRA
jgi:hypothetical protein